MLRPLADKDVDGILEWMNDKEIMDCFTLQKDKMCKEEVYQFIKESNTETTKHYAIVNEADEYLGTVSLKNIDYINSNAEYAIVLRKGVISKGIGAKATREILEIAFNQLKLYKVYLNVLSENKRAIKFYEKMKFMYEGELKNHLKINNKYKHLKLYAVFNKELSDER